MNLDMDNFEEWEIAQKITIKYLKNIIEDYTFESDKELKAYLWVLSDNMWIGDFIKYAKEKNLEDHCKKIYKTYKLDGWEI